MDNRDSKFGRVCEIGVKSNTSRKKEQDRSHNYMRNIDLTSCNCWAWQAGDDLPGNDWQLGWHFDREVRHKCLRLVVWYHVNDRWTIFSIIGWGVRERHTETITLTVTISQLWVTWRMGFFRLISTSWRSTWNQGIKSESREAKQLTQC